MDIKIEIKDEDPLSDDRVSHNETEFCATNVTIKTESDALFLNMAIKREFKSETPFTDFYSQKEVKSEGIACRSVNNEREIRSQKEIECLPDNVVMINSDHEIVIKEEPWWPETGTSSHTKIGDFIPVNSPRLCIKAAADDGLPSPETSGENTSFSYGKDCSKCESEEIAPTEEHVRLKQSGKHNEGEVSDRASLIHKAKKLHKCKNCDKSFTQLTALNLHNLTHKGKKPHKCEICDKDFAYLCDLKRHTLIHEGIRPHKCNICDKRFTNLSDLNKHTLIHEGKRPYKCKICEKGFTLLSTLKKHNLIHEDRKPLKCGICEKGFFFLSDLKMHTFVHADKKPHRCQVCENGFINLSDLKRHTLIHERKKPHTCEICHQTFARLCGLKRHNIMHEASQVQRS